MTDIRKAAQAVIDILEHNDIKINDAVHNALNNLRQALAAPVEPIIRSQQYNDEVYRDKP